MWESQVEFFFFKKKITFALVINEPRTSCLILYVKLNKKKKLSRVRLTLCVALWLELKYHIWE